jgi:hypothetical protein
MSHGARAPLTSIARAAPRDPTPVRAPRGLAELRLLALPARTLVLSGLPTHEVDARYAIVPVGVSSAGSLGLVTTAIA